MKKWVYLVIISLILMGAGVWQYSKYISKMTDSVAKKVVIAVSNLMVLPDEVPTIATVTDESQLVGQNFFKSAKNGDKILIYKQAAKAIIYRPEINKIVEVTSILPGNQNNPSSANAELVEVSTEVVENETANKQPEIALYNGTKEVGLTNRWEKKISDNFSEVKIIAKEKAVNTDYQRTVVIDISGKFKKEMADLADFLGARVVALPQGEISPAADGLIILGKEAI